MDSVGVRLEKNYQIWERSQRLLAALRRIEAEGKNRPGLRLLDVAYGPRASAMRKDALRLLLGRLPTAAEVSWGSWRKIMLAAVLADPEEIFTCTAVADAAFEERAAMLLHPPLTDVMHPERYLTMNEVLLNRLKLLAEDVKAAWGEDKDDRLLGATAAILHAIAGAVHAGQSDLLFRHGKNLTEDGLAAIRSRRN